MMLEHMFTAKENKIIHYLALGIMILLIPILIVGAVWLFTNGKILAIFASVLCIVLALFSITTRTS